ncbi:MAG: hypothetical protein JWP35_3398 [Caulobacter sp.]|nr:hypothetical protein [Caulobacter sp.]
MLNPDPDAALERIRALCLALPDTGEKISHGVPAFQVGGRMFAYFRHDHHGDGLTAVCVKTTGRDEQEMLMEAEPDLFTWPAYIGPSGWLNLSIAAADTDWDHVAARLRTSWALARPARKGARP